MSDVSRSGLKLEKQYRPHIEKIVEKVFDSAEIGVVKRFVRGYSSVAFDVELKNPQRQVVIKIVEKEYSEESREKEKHVWDLLKEKYNDFPVPEVYAFDTSKTVIDKSYSVLERIEGNTLSQMWDKLPEKGEIYREIGKLTGMIHAISFEKYGELNPNLQLKDSFTNWQEKCDRDVEKAIDTLRKRDYVDNKFINRQVKFWSKSRIIIQDETTPVLCWGDVGMGNIIVKLTRLGKYVVSGIIDFEFARSGGAVHDIFSRVRAFEHHYDNRNQIFSGHQKYSSLPKNYSELAIIYHWLASLSELSKVPNMNWHGVDEKSTEERKNIIITNNKKRVDGAIKQLP